MNTINSLLIGGADFLLRSFELLLAACGALWGAIDYVLNPLLSPALSFLNPISTFVGDAVYAPLRFLPVWFGLTIISIVTGIIMLIAFRYLSNQSEIGRAKDDIKANLLAMKLFQDELRVMFRAQLRLVGAIARLQRYVLAPVLVMLVPMLLGLAQMGIRYQWRPLHAGESTIIRMTLSSNDASEPRALARADVPFGSDVPASSALRFPTTHPPNPPEFALEPNVGAIVEAGPVPGGGVVAWRIRGGAPGRHMLSFLVDGHALQKELVVGDGFERVSALRPTGNWIDQLLHPVEPLPPPDSPVASIQILYPGVDSWIHGSDYWVLYFFVISMLAALLLKPVFKVKF